MCSSLTRFQKHPKHDLKNLFGTSWFSETIQKICEIPKIWSLLVSTLNLIHMRWDDVRFICQNLFWLSKLFCRLLPREKCLHAKFFWFVFSRIRTEYGEIRSVSPYSVRMWENTDQKIFEYGHFLCSVY